MKLNLIQLGSDVLEVTTDTADKHDVPTRIPEKYPDLFQDGISKSTVVHKITVDPNIPPAIRSARTIPVHYQEKMKATFDKMVIQGIIAPVTRPTDHVSAMVLAAKKNADDISVY